MTKQVTELNKTIQDLKREVDTIKKTQSEGPLEIETLEKNSGTRDAIKSGTIFSGVLGCPGLGGVGVLRSDDGEWSWFLLVRFLCLPFTIW